MVLRTSILTPDYVTTRSGGQFLYCALHRTFHDRSEFSTGSNGQQRQATRYCLHASAAEVAAFATLANMVPTDEGRKEGARRLGMLREFGYDEAQASARAERAISNSRSVYASLTR